jgi:trans-2,3-dihydro-3-hydroxyanthranilate isomerase
MYVVSEETVSESSDMYCRFFAPALGITEDAATGCAAVGLASLLAEQDARDSFSKDWHIEQGIAIGRPSKLVVGVEKHLGSLRRIWLSGTAAYAGRGEIEVQSSDRQLDSLADTDEHSALGDVFAAV